MAAIVFSREGFELAWYRNHYHCGDCGTDWDDEWSCCCDDECPNCGSRNWSPIESVNLTEIIQEQRGAFLACISPPTAEHYPDYVVVRTFETEVAARRFIVDGELT